MHRTTPADGAQAPVETAGAGSARVGLAAIAATLLLAAMGQTIVSPALPMIAADLGAVDFVAWIVTAYLLAATVGAPVFGKLGDLYGRRVVLKAGIGVFLAGSLLAGLAGSVWMLVAGRFVQGLGGGGLIVVCMAAAADLLPPRERGRAQAMLGAAFGVATVAGPLLGGLIVQTVGWPYIFFLNLPVGALALVAIARVQRLPVPAGRRVIDFAGAGLLAVILSALVLVASLGGRALAWDAPAMLALIAAGGAATLAFGAVERRAADPILPLPLFRNNAFAVVNAGGALSGLAMFGTITFLPLFLQVVKGASPTLSGLFLAPMMAGLILASQWSGRVMARTGRYRMMPVAAYIVLAAAMAGLAMLTAATPLWVIVVLMVLTGIGLGPAMGVGVAAIQNAVPPSMLGVGTASANMFRLIGGAVGTAALGAVFAAGLATEPLAAGVRFTAAGMAALPPDLQAILIDRFAAALHPVFALAALAAALAAALSLALREVPLGETARG
ncbi:MAG: MFS transporter [Gemmobacter sp.]